MRLNWFGLPLLLVVAGCAWDEGKGFGTITEASLAARLEVTEDRELGDHTVQTENGEVIHLEEAVVSVDQVRLLAEAEGVAEDGSFDPAHPPAGYSLCHGGHCHAEDGSLVAYEVIEAELAEAETTQTVPVVEMLWEGTLDLLQGAEVELTQFEPSRELPRCVLAQVEVAISGLRLSGTVTPASASTEVGETALPFTAVQAAPLNLSCGLRLRVDEEGPANFGLALAIEATEALIDGLDTSGLAAATEVTASPVRVTDHWGHAATLHAHIHEDAADEHAHEH